MSAIQYVIRDAQIICEQFDDERVIVDLESGSYYSLSGAGGEIWKVLENGAGQIEIMEHLTRIYSGDKTEIEVTVANLLRELQEEKLIVIDNAANFSSAFAPTLQDGNATLVWETPVLQKYTDMEALLLLDPIHEVDSAGWPKPKVD